MASSVVGSSTVLFITLKGLPEPAGLVLADASRAGVDGSAYLELQETGDPFEVDALRDCLSWSDADTVYASLKAMQGTKVSVIDDGGTIWLNVVILSVRKTLKKKMVKCAGGVLSGTGTVLLGVRFVMQVAR